MGIPDGASKIGNTIPMGLFAFAITAGMGGLANLGVASSDSALFNVFSMIGGVIQAVSGLFEFIKGGTGPGTIFFLFGMFCIAYSLMLWPNLFDMSEAYPNSQEFWNLQGSFNAMFCLVTFTLSPLLAETSVVQLGLILVAGTNFALLSACTFTRMENDSLKLAQGVVGCLTGILAFWSGAGVLLNEESYYVQIPLFQLPKPSLQNAKLKGQTEELSTDV